MFSLCLSHRVQTPRAGSRFLYPMHVYRKRTAGSIQEMRLQKRDVLKVQYKINRSFKYKRVALDTYVSDEHVSPPL